MTSPDGDMTGEFWSAVRALLPEDAKAEADELDPGQRSDLVAWLRRDIVTAHEEKEKSQNLVAPNELPDVVRRVRALPIFGPEEIASVLEELKLSGAEAEAERANWAFRHQAVAGDVVLADRLLPFRFIRFAPEIFFWLAVDPPPDVVAVVEKAFAPAAGVASGRPLAAGGEAWRAWAWFTDPDPDQARADAERLEHFWRRHLP